MSCFFSDWCLHIICYLFFLLYISLCSFPLFFGGFFVLGNISLLVRWLLPLYSLFLCSVYMQNFYKETDYTHYLVVFSMYGSVDYLFTLNSVPSPAPMSNATAIATILGSILGGVALVIMLCLIVVVVVICTKRVQSKQGGSSG